MIGFTRHSIPKAVPVPDPEDEWDDDVPALIEAVLRCGSLTTWDYAAHEHVARHKAGAYHLVPYRDAPAPAILAESRRAVAEAKRREEIAQQEKYWAGVRAYQEGLARAETERLAEAVKNSNVAREMLGHIDRLSDAAKGGDAAARKLRSDLAWAYANLIER